MPSVLRRHGLDVKVWGPPREHPPPHAHVHIGKRGLVVVRMSIGDVSAKVWRVYGEIDLDDVKAAVRLVETHEKHIRREWEKLHG